MKTEILNDLFKLVQTETPENDELQLNEASKIISTSAAIVYLNILLKKEQDSKNKDIIQAVINYLDSIRKH